MRELQGGSAWPRKNPASEEAGYIGAARLANHSIQFLGGFMPIAVGQPAPDFTLKDQSQKEVKLSDFAGKHNVVLIFYPLDFSPVCTNEHACFVNELNKF